MRIGFNFRVEKGDLEKVKTLLDEAQEEMNNTVLCTECSISKHSAIYMVRMFLYYPARILMYASLCCFIPAIILGSFYTFIAGLILLSLDIMVNTSYIYYLFIKFGWKIKHGIEISYVRNTYVLDLLRVYGGKKYEYDNNK